MVQQMAPKSSSLQTLATVPKINLLPAAIIERRARVRQRKGCGAVAGFLLLLLVGWFLIEHNRATSAQAAQQRQEAQTSRLQAQQQALAPYAALDTRVKDLERTRATVYANEIRLSSVLQDVSTITPLSVALTSMAITETPAQPKTVAPAGTAATPPGAPGAGTTVARITFSGTAGAYADVSKFLLAFNNAAKRRGLTVYVNPYFSSTTKTPGVSGAPPTVTFAATVDLAPAAFSGRFQRPDALGGS